MGAQRPELGFHPLHWESRDPDSLSVPERRAVETSPFMDPSNWRLEVAADTLGTTPILFVRSRIGSGTGYGSEAAYAFVPGRSGPIWSFLTHQWLVQSEYLPPGVEGYAILGCLYRANRELLGYVFAVAPPNSTAQDAIATDTLVRSAGWYRWTGATFVHLDTLPAEVLQAQCRESLQQESQH
jgi:hypothetical protein